MRNTTPATPLVFVAFVVLVATGAGVVAAHGNELVVEDQVSADGSVLVEHVSYIENAYLVARVPTGDGPGEPVGQRYLPVSGTTFGERDLVALDLKDTYWETRESERLWVVLHHEDGDDGFDVSEDPLIEQSGEAVGRRVTVARGDGNVSVAAFDQETNATVTVRRVELAAPGHLVVHGNGSDGPPIGHVSLDAGVHTNVTVPVDGYYYNDQAESFDAATVVHRDDDDGEFDPATDDPVRAGEAPVASALVVTKATPSVAVTPTATETPTPSPTPTSSPTPTRTATETPTSSPTGTPVPTATPTAEPADTPGGERTTDATGPALGALASLVVVVLAAVAATRRR